MRHNSRPGALPAPRKAGSVIVIDKEPRKGKQNDQFVLKKIIFNACFLFSDRPAPTLIIKNNTRKVARKTVKYYNIINKRISCAYDIYELFNNKIIISLKLLKLTP